MLDVGEYLDTFIPFLSSLGFVLAVMGTVLIVVGVFIGYFVVQDNLAPAMITSFLGVCVMIAGLVVGVSEQQNAWNDLNDKVVEVLIEEGDLDSASGVKVANDIANIYYLGENGDSSETSLPPTVKKDFSFKIDDVTYFTNLVFSLEGDELNIGVLSSSTSSVVPLSPEAFRAADKVDDLADM